MATENYTMKEIIQETLEKFKLNNFISEESKQEIRKEMRITRDILYLIKDEDYILLVTDIAIYYRLIPDSNLYNFFCRNNIKTFVKIRDSYICWDEIESIHDEFKEIKGEYYFPVVLKGREDKECDIYTKYPFYSIFFKEVVIESQEKGKTIFI